MADVKFQPVRHDHEEFLENASKRHGFSEAYEALDVEYALAHEMLAARARAGLTQEAVAGRMGTTKSAISRLEAAGETCAVRGIAEEICSCGGLHLEDRACPRCSAKGGIFAISSDIELPLAPIPLALSSLP